MKKQFILAFALFSVLFMDRSFAQKSLGGRLGISSPNSFVTVSFKNEYNGSAIEFNGGLTLSNPAWFTGQIDYYFFERELDFGIDGLTQWYVGAGGQVWFGSNDFVLGPDAKIGLEYKLENVPIEFFIDFTAFLGIDFENGSSLGSQLGLGVRKTF